MTLTTILKKVLTKKYRFDINRLVITLEAENKCQLTSSSAIEMRVSQLSCASKKWTVCKMDRNQGLLCLLPSENGVVHLKGSLLKHDSSTSGLVYTDVPLGPTIVSVEVMGKGNYFFSIFFREERERECVLRGLRNSNPWLNI